MFSRRKSVKELFSKKENIDEDELVIELRRKIKSLFAEFIEELQDLDMFPNELTKIAKAYFNLVTWFAIPIALPNLRVVPNEGYEKLLGLMIGDMSDILANHTSSFNTKSIKLANDISNTIRKTRNKIKDDEDFSVKLKGIVVSTPKFDQLPNKISEPTNNENVNININNGNANGNANANGNGNVIEKKPISKKTTQKRVTTKIKDKKDKIEKKELSKSEINKK